MICLNCRKEKFAYRKSQIYCSNQCRVKHSKPTMLGKKHSLESKRKISLGGKGLVRSLDARKNIALGKMGDKNPAKRADVRKKISEACTGRTPWNKGIPMSLEQRAKLSFIQGSKKGFVTPIHRLVRKSPEYKTWRNLVFRRDDYTCQMCGERGLEIQADHVLPFSLYPDMRLDPLNGQTLCVECHKKTDTYQNNIIKYARENENFVTK